MQSYPVKMIKCIKKPVHRDQPQPIKNKYIDPVKSYDMAGKPNYQTRVENVG